MRRSVAYPALALAVAAPRLAVLLYEQGAILAGYTEKSDVFATTFVDSGTYGFVPGFPSAWTQPLYGFLLVPLYGTVGRSWAAVGLFQIGLAILLAWLVYELGRRWIGPLAGLLAAGLLALNPYLAWHDVHVNRELVDALAAAAVVLAAVAAADRRSLRLAALAGALTGVAILGNARLVGLPVVLIAFLAWRWRDAGRTALAGGALLAAAALVLAPWVVRNEIQVGCWAITTDSRALWKANNVNTDDVLESGQWIDAVPPLPGAPPLTPEFAGDIWRNDHRKVAIDECGQMRLYRDAVLDFWREHPGEKAELAGRGVAMLWDPRVTTTEGGPGANTRLDTARLWVGGFFFSALFLLALAGVPRIPRRLAVLAAGLLAYQTLAAMVFLGATRYRAPWDFLLALPAGAALAALAGRRWRPR